MNLKEVKEDVLRKVGIEFPNTAPDYVDEDVLTAINTAGQVLNSAGFPFWKIDKESVDATSDLDSTNKIYTKTIDGHSVKRVVVRLQESKLQFIPLLRSPSEDEVINFHFIYGSDKNAQYKYPLVYFAEYDPVENNTIVKIGPEHSVGPNNWEITIEYVPRFLNYTGADIDNSSIIPDVAHEYVEMVFLPLARFYITRSHWFSYNEMLPKLEQDFTQALSVIKQINPSVHIPHQDQLKNKEAVSGAN